MYLTFAISIAVLALLWLAVRGRSAEIRDMRAAEKAIVPVDLEAFRNLIDVQQERYLRERLSVRDFRRVQRTRYRAMAEYLRCVAANASIIARVGEAAHSSHEPAVEKQGSELASAAVVLRVYCLVALAQAYAGLLFPGAAVSAGSIVDSYDRLTVKLWSVGRAWAPVSRAS